MSEASITMAPEDEAAGEPPVLVRREGAVAWLTLNRPASGNSIDAPLAAALRQAVARLDADAGVRALVIEGAGRMFCTGGDLASFAKEGSGASLYVKALIADLHAAFAQLAQFHAPVIASVHGAAAGAGLGLALATDLIVAEEASRFVMAYTRAGLTPDGGTSWGLTRAVGLRQALALTLLNRTLSANEALAMGLVSEVTKDGAAAERVAGIARELAAGPTRAFATARRLLRDGMSADYREQLDAEGAAIVASFTSIDGLEGVCAFSERRPAVFRGV